MERIQRRFLVCLTSLAALAALVQGISGVTGLVLYLTPLFLIAALLLSGRYIAEERIVRRWRRGSAPRRPRAVRSRWPSISDAPTVSILERSPSLERGPPALASA